MSSEQIIVSSSLSLMLFSCLSHLVLHSVSVSHLSIDSLLGAPLNPITHPDYNPNLLQIFHLQFQSPSPIYQQYSCTHLQSVSLDTCSRITSLGLQILIDHCPQLESINMFGNANLSLLDLHSLLRLIQQKHSKLTQLDVGGSTTVNQREIDQLRKEFKQITF